MLKLDAHGGQVAHLHQRVAREFLLDGEGKLGRIAGALVEVEAGLRKGDVADGGAAAEDIEAPEGGDKGRSGIKVLRDVRGEAARQLQQSVEVGIGVEDPAAQADNRARPDVPGETEAGSKVVAIGEGAAAGIAAKAAGEEGGAVEVRAILGKDLGGPGDLGEVDAGHLAAAVPERLGEFVAQAEV